jgi:flagellar assembly protein FliH
MSSSRKSTTVIFGHAVQILQRANEAPSEAKEKLPAPAAPVQHPQRDYERGLADGKAQALKELSGAVEALKAATLQIHAHTQEFQRNLDHHGVVLAMRIAEKIIGRAVADAKTVQHMIAQTLLQVPMKRGLKIRLSPTDAAALLELREKHGASCSAVPEDAEIIPDPAITKGGCIIDSMLGRVDARIETQLELLDRALNDRPIGAGVNNG